jgi:hypothetical protein
MFSCLATQSVPNVSATDNDLWKTEFTPVCFGAQENSVVDVGLVCQGELTSVQYSVSYCTLLHEGVIVHC